jgi:hypothetical protein
MEMNFNFCLYGILVNIKFSLFSFKSSFSSKSSVTPETSSSVSSKDLSGDENDNLFVVSSKLSASVLEDFFLT